MVGGGDQGVYLEETYSVPTPCDEPPSSKVMFGNVPESSSSASSSGRPSASRSTLEVRPKRSATPFASA
jgi:hypothetical protein